MESKNKYCKYCEKELIGHYRSSLYCNKKCSRDNIIYRIKVLTPPDRWVKCEECEAEFPVWAKLQSPGSKNPKYCSRPCSTSGTQEARSAAIRKTAGAKTAVKYKCKPKFDRSKQCFKKEPFGNSRCTKYEKCEFDICTGYENP